MSPDSFARFYRAVHGYPPFPWQVRLARQVVENGWPSVLALPTSAGKTSAIDVAVFALALQAGLPLTRRTAPLRIFFVIDRRLVVDQVAEHARRLKQALDDPEKLGPQNAEGAVAVREVTQALLQFGGLGVLHVATMRGGMYRDDSWTKTPNQPTVCVTTVDQAGSRLLFRGYGVSEYARPVHAALTGNDALYLVDEAHLSQPFLETLRAVQGYRTGPWAERPMGGPFSVVEISATPQSNEPPFRLAEDDHADPELSRRLTASKPAALTEPLKFEEEACRLAVQACSGDSRVVGIVVNRVASAREVFQRLPGEPLLDKVLLTGRIRPWDRDAILGSLLPRVRAGRVRAPEDRPLFVAATMTVEVGADLDFDHLVTEAAPLSALRQRFGRLDRLGRFGRAAGKVVLRRSKGPDPIYGDDLARTWQWLRTQAERAGGVIDFGIGALERLMGSAATPPPLVTSKPAPVLFPAHLDAWAQTSPAPQPDPDVAPFLHGAEALDTADVQVVWRADLLEEQGDEDWLRTVAIAPPLSREAMPLPVVAVRKWLRQSAPAEVADVEGVADPERQAGPGRRVLRWAGPDDSSVTGPEQIRPGDTLVVPATYGGADEFGWHPESVLPVSDVGDLCLNDMSNRAPDGNRERLIRLRLHATLIADLPELVDGIPRASVGELVREMHALLEAGEDHTSCLTEVLDALGNRLSGDSLTAAVVRQMGQTRPRVVAYPAGIVLTARARPGFARASPERVAPLEEENVSEEGSDVDETTSLRAGIYRPAAVTLEEHTAGVVRWLQRFADRLGLDGPFAAVLTRAAKLHDLGKADRRFQFVLYGDEPGDTLLAKSGRDLGAAQRATLWRLSGLPRGFRHEFVSVGLVRQYRRQLLADLDAAQGCLVEWLVGTHHGRGRPFVPYVEEGAQTGVAEQITLDWAGQRLTGSPNHRLWHLEAGWADQFWALVHRFGWWGLAFLEGLLRLADTARSAEEQHGEGGT